MNGKYPFSPILFALTHALLVIALAFGGKPSRFNVLLFTPILLLSIFITFFTASDDRAGDYVLCMASVGTLFHAVDVVLLRNYQPELRKIGQKKPTGDMTFLERMWWAARLSVSSRGIGWAHETTAHIPPHPKGGRLQFVVYQLAWLGAYFLIFDVAAIMIRANPCFSVGGPSLTAFGWAWRSTVWTFPVYTCASMSMLYIALSIFCVTVRLSEPQDWPHLFDSPRRAYTLRNCWGKVWHQMLRKRFTTLMDFISDSLHLPKGQFRKYFKLYGTFFFSGVLHYLGDYMLFQNWSGTSVQFFLLQAVAITFEDMVVALAARLGFTRPTPASRFLGFLWVFVWFTYSLPFWLGPSVHVTGAVDESMNVSLILGIWRGEWIPTRTPL